MADRTVGDTFPAIRGFATVVDDAGVQRDLSDADDLKCLIYKAGVGILASLAAVAVQPPETDSDDNTWNWEAAVPAVDTLDTAGAYSIQLKITWDSGTSPPEIQYVPTGSAPAFEIQAAGDGA